MSDFYVAARGPKRRPGLARARDHQAILAERLQWPDGTLETCLRLESEHPCWLVAWLGENTVPGYERPAGFWAVLDQGVHSVEAFAADADELVAKMATAPPEHDFSIRGCDWCRTHIGTYGRVRL
jgi:hypothetical protein